MIANMLIFNMSYVKFMCGCDIDSGVKNIYMLTRMTPPFLKPHRRCSWLHSCRIQGRHYLTHADGEHIANHDYDDSNDDDHDHSKDSYNNNEISKQNRSSQIW